MKYLEERTRQVTEALTQWPDLAGCVVCSAYTQAVKPTRLKRPRICVCLRSVQVEPVLVGGDGRRVRGQFGIDLYLPDENGAAMGLGLCDEMLECLLIKGDLPGSRFVCGEPHIDSATGTLLVRCIFEEEEVLV